MTRRKILILDDQMLGAFQVAQTLEENGFDVAGPFGNVTDALREIESDAPDAALLDINMGDGTTSEALADILMKQELPFAFLTGYGSADVMPGRFSTVDYATKPVRERELVTLAEKLVKSAA